MRISCVLTVHRADPTTLDTLDAVSSDLADEVVAVCDGASEPSQFDRLPCRRVEGFRHGRSSAPVRNVALALAAADPKADWTVFMEPDCAVSGGGFRRSLADALAAPAATPYLMGFCGRPELGFDPPALRSLFGGPPRRPYYTIGACRAFSREFMDRMRSAGTLRRLLHLTNSVGETPPGFSGYDLSEPLYPSLARQWGGTIGVFSTHDDASGSWYGNFMRYPVRWRPELDHDDPLCLSAHLSHPVKDFDHPIRVAARRRRSS